MQRPRNLRPAWASVDLTAVRSNARHLVELAEGRRLRGVLKADAYGHGAIEIARALGREGVGHFAVALVEEGMALRQAGIEGSILSMGMATPGQCGLARSHGLTPAISSLEQLGLWAGLAGRGGRPIDVHLKVNTGMNRLGLAPEEFGAALDQIRSEPGLVLAGVMSHFADADILQSARTDLQLERFVALLTLLTEPERAQAEIHIGNSAGHLHHDLAGTTSFRPGLALFGYDPAAESNRLKPALSVYGKVVKVHHVEPGECVGYGGLWVAERQSRIGIVPLGYADGYTARLARDGEALVRGHRVPLVGSVSMDMLAIDLTDSATGEGEEVVLLGTDGAELIDAFDLARHAGVPVYEILCGFGLRLPKVFLEQDEVVAVTSKH